MPRAYHKLFLATPVVFGTLSIEARVLFAYLHMQPVEPDGTVALLKHGEKPHLAVMRTLGIPTNRRRRYREVVGELLQAGFLQVDGDRVVLPNWEARQRWRKGSVPPPFCDPEARHQHDQRATKARHAHDRTATKVRHPNPSNPSDSLDTAWANETSTPSLILASKGRSPFSSLTLTEPEERKLESTTTNGTEVSSRSAKVRTSSQGSEEWCVEELDPFDAELWAVREGAS